MPTERTAARIAIQQFMESQRFGPEELELRFRQASDPNYWRALNPRLNVCSNLPFDAFEPGRMEEAQDSLVGRLTREGYISSSRPLVKREATEMLLGAIVNLKQSGWHESWACVYDEFWQMLQAPFLKEFLPQSLGPKYKAMPHAVVHYVAPEFGAGWSPHVDFSDRDGRLTVWLAISDATLDNGCMHVVPKSRVAPDLLKKWLTMKDLSHRETTALLHAGRALPVEAGSILAWEDKVIHWGAFSMTGVPPRVSLSAVFLREGVEPLPDELPLLPPLELPTYAQRLLIVAKAINYYKMHVLSLTKYGDLGRKIEEAYRQQAEDEARSCE